MRGLLITVDSLRYDHFEYMPSTRSFLSETHDRAFATYGDKKAAMNADNIATDSGMATLDCNELIENPSLERALSRFEPGRVVKEDALEEDLEDLGYL
ncbi:hypothetical protein [Halobacterium zhouii]|uniref:hypothetical protein n=1 Tax=Halobacterium zhouii TaxID=2902624 RepID=UPI001E63D393|nr:hypothetical protein [Halobacterium zhouii]